jgi:hypothetical protein
MRDDVFGKNFKSLLCFEGFIIALGKNDGQV